VGVRRIRANPWSLTGYVPSRKEKPACAFESRLERDFATLQEFDPLVERYDEQPLEIFYTAVGGRRVKGVPDFLVHYTPEAARSPLLVDVKYRKEIFKNWPKLKPRFRAALDYARSRGWGYRIMTEVEIESHYLVNARFLLPFRRQHASDHSLVDRVLDLLISAGKTTPAALQAAHSSDRWQQAEILPTIWHLVAIHAIEVNLSLPLSMCSQIWAKQA
jgi:hypothetical protein